MAVDLPGIRAQLELDLTLFRAQTAQAQAAMAKLGADLQAAPGIKVPVDTRALDAEVVRLKAALAAAGQGVPPITPHLNDQAVRTEIAGLRGFISQAFQNFGGITSVPGLGFLTTAPALVGAASIGAALGLIAKQAVDVGLAFAQADRQIAVSTGKAGSDLSGLQASFRAVAAAGKGSLEDITTVLTQLSIRTEATGPALEALTRNVLKFSALAGGDVRANTADLARLFKNWEIATEDQAGTLDKFITIMQRTGEAPGPLIEALSHFHPLLSTLGLDLDHAASFLAKLEEAGVPAREVLVGLKQAADKFVAGGQDPAVALRTLLTSIQTLGTEGEAEAVAIEHFGSRAGLAIAELSRSGKLNTDELVAALQTSAGAMDRTFTATQTAAKQAGQAFEALLRQLEPVGAGLISIGGLLAVNLTGAVKDLKAESEGMGAGLDTFIARVSTALADLDTLRKQAALPLPVPDVAAESPGPGPFQGTPGTFLNNALGTTGAGKKTADAIMDEFALEIRRHAADPSLGGDALQRFTLNLFAPEKLAAALRETTAPGFDKFIELLGAQGAEAARTFDSGFTDTARTDALGQAIAAQEPAISRALALLSKAGQDGGAALLAAYESGVAAQTPALFADLAALKERAAAALAGGGDAPGQEAQFRESIAATFRGIDPRIVDTMWAQITSRSKALAGQGGEEVGQEHAAAIAKGLLTDADKLKASAGILLNSIDDVFRHKDTISIPLELGSPQTTQARIALLQQFQQTLSDTEQHINSLTDADKRAALTVELNNAKTAESAVGLAQVAAAARAAAAEQAVLGGRYDQLANATLPGLTAAQAELVKQFQLAHDPATAAALAVQLVGGSAQDAARALQGTGADFTRYVQGLQRIAESADPVASAHRLIEASAKSALSSIAAGLSAADRAWLEYRAARTSDAQALTELASHFGIDPEKVKAALAQGGQAFADLQAQMARVVATADPVAAATHTIEASAKSMLDTLSAGLPAADRAWLQYTAARQGDAATLRSLYAQMGGDLDAFDHATEAQQQRSVARLAQARQAAEVFHSTGRLLPAPQETDLLGPQRQQQVEDQTRAQARQAQDLAVQQQRTLADRQRQAVDFARQGAQIDTDFAQRQTDIANTLANAQASITHARGVASADFQRGQLREIEDANLAFTRQQRDRAQQDAESLRGLREQAGDLLVGATSQFHAAAASAVQDLLGLSGASLTQAAAGVVDRFQGVSEASQQAAQQIVDAQTTMLDKIRDTFQQINRQASDTIKGIRDQLLQSGQLGNTPSLFGGIFTNLPGQGSPEQQAALKATADRNQAILDANLKIADTATKQQSILDTAARARADLDKQADAAQKDLNKQLLDLNKQARDQRAQMIEQLTRQVEAFQRADFLTGQGREDQRIDQGLAQGRQAEDQQRAFERSVNDFLAQDRAAQQAAADADRASRQQREEQRRQLQEQERQAALQQRRQDEDLARQEQRRREDLRIADDRFNEQVRLARAQIALGERTVALLERRPQGVQQNFNLPNMVLVEPATQFLDIGEEQLRQRINARTVG